MRKILKYTDLYLPDSMKLSALIMIGDVFFVGISFFISFCIKYTFSSVYFSFYLQNIWYYMAIVVGVFSLMKLYTKNWKIKSFKGLIRITVSTVLALIFHYLIYEIRHQDISYAYFLIGTTIQYVFTCIARAILSSYLEDNKR